MPQAAAVFAEFAATVGRIHQVVEVRDPLRAHQGERNGGATIVHRCAGQQRGNGHATVGGVQMGVTSRNGNLRTLRHDYGDLTGRSGRNLPFGVPVHSVRGVPFSNTF